MTEQHSLLFSWVPVTLCGLVLLLGPLCIYLFLSVKVELRLLARHAASRDELNVRLHAFTEELAALRGRLQETEAKRPVPAGWPSEPAAVDLNRRGQILRLHRRGQTPREIAADLHIPLGEVELMVKVHTLPQETADAALSAAAL